MGAIGSGTPISAASRYALQRLATASAFVCSRVIKNLPSWRPVVTLMLPCLFQSVRLQSPFMLLYNLSLVSRRSATPLWLVIVPPWSCLQ